MIEYHATLDVIIGQERAFEKAFAAEYSATIRRQPGVVAAGLLREQAGEAGAPPRYQIVIRFADPDAAAAWHASADHRALGPSIRSHGVPLGAQVYDVVA
jgi:antibiotic biosynthesis monooxygenase (ABM) superfamily enzyme